MAGIAALVTLLSLDVSAALVAAGYVAQPAVNVAGATNATPIVVATAAPHGITLPTEHVVIAGVAGNTAANGTWIATPVDTTHFSLSTMGPDGTVTPVAGSGAYTSGGTVSQAFVDGRILLGRQHIAENSSPPRVVFVPLSSTFGPRSVSSRSNVAGNMSAEQLYASQARSLATEKVTFEVHVWGLATSGDDDANFDATQVLYQQVIRTANLIATGRVGLGSGRWVEAESGASQVVRLGRGYVFELELETPVLDKLLARVQGGTVAGSTVYLQPADGSPPEIAATGI